MCEAKTGMLLENDFTCLTMSYILIFFSHLSFKLDVRPFYGSAVTHSVLAVSLPASRNHALVQLLTSMEMFNG